MENRQPNAVVHHLMNGHIGTVMGFCTRTKMPVVKFDHTSIGTFDVINAVKHEIRDGDDRLLFDRVQIPLTLAHGVTFHKSQGLSLDKLAVDFHRCFAPGHAYVALSRSRSPGGLLIYRFTEEAIKADQRVIDFYSEFTNSAPN
jgi:ATP-dependent exoDNAse (exonuclease V) alpha subunit